MSENAVPLLENDPKKEFLFLNQKSTAKASTEYRAVTTVLVEFLHVQE